MQRVVQRLFITLKHPQIPLISEKVKNLTPCVEAKHKHSCADQCVNVARMYIELGYIPHFVIRSLHSLYFPVKHSCTWRVPILTDDPVYM
jgi:hypothetical protein